MHAFLCISKYTCNMLVLLLSHVRPQPTFLASLYPCHIAGKEKLSSYNPPENKQMSPEKGPFNKSKLYTSEPTINFQGTFVRFQGGYSPNLHFSGVFVLRWCFFSPDAADAVQKRMRFYFFCQGHGEWPY